MKNVDLSQLLTEIKFNPLREPPQRQDIFIIKWKTVGSFGDFVVYSGKPKVGKSKYIAGSIAAAISKFTVFDLTIKLPPEREHVVHFDTEQSEYSHYKMMELTSILGGYGNVESLPNHFSSFRCRGMAPHRICDTIDFYLSKNPMTGIVFLDGLLDVISNMNDTNDSNRIKTWLKNITEKYKILLIAVIHRGFTNDKSIGHIGSESERAAQSILVVEKLKDFTPYRYRLRAEFMRDDEDFEPVDIIFNKQLSLWESADYIPEEKKGKFTKVAKRKPSEIDIMEHTVNVGRLFNSIELHSFDSLRQEIVEVYGETRTWATECIKFLVWEAHLIWKTPEGYTNRNQARLFIADKN